MKRRLLSAALLVTAVITLFTGCFIDFGPAEASTPEISLDKKVVGLSEPISFEILNWRSSLDYIISVNGKVCRNAGEGPEYRIAPETKWANGINVLEVEVRDSIGGVKTNSVKFSGEAKNTVSAKLERGTVTLTPNFEKLGSIADCELVWTITFNGTAMDKSVLEVVDNTRGETPLKVTVPYGAKYNTSWIAPDVRYSVRVLRGGKDIIEEPLKGVIYLPVPLVPVETRREKIDENGMGVYKVTFKNEWPFGDEFRYTLTINGGTSINPVEIIGPDFMDEYYGRLTLPLLPKFDNWFQIEAKYKSKGVYINVYSEKSDKVWD